MKCFGFKLLDVFISNDAMFWVDIGSWDTFNHRGSILFIEYFDHKWQFDFLSARTLYQIYHNWREG